MPLTPHTPTPLAYHIAFSCYGRWLHGDDRGSVDRHHNTPGTPFMKASRPLSNFEFAELSQQP